MSEIKNLEGEIQKANDDLKQVGKPGNYKWGVMVKSEWYGFFGTRAVLEAIKAEYDAGAHHIKGTYKDAAGKDGTTYHNIEGAKLSKTEARERPPEERTDPAQSLSGAKEPPVKEERIGVEEVEALVDKHYIDMMDRARRIINQAEYQRTAPWTSKEEKALLLCKVFDKLAAPKIYAEDEAWMRAEKKGAK